MPMAAFIGQFLSTRGLTLGEKQFLYCLKIPKIYVSPSCARAIVMRVKKRKMHSTMKPKDPLNVTFLSIKQSVLLMDDYAKDGGPEVV